MSKSLEKKIMFSDKASEQYKLLKSYLNEHNYSDYYGGAYIDTENEHLLLFFTEQIEEIGSNIHQIGEYGDVLVKKVRYTLSELNDKKNDISTLIRKNQDLSDAVLGIGISEKENAVVIEFWAKKINETSAKNVLAEYKDCIKIIMREQQNFLQKNVEAGTYEDTNSFPNYGTISCCANRTNSLGKTEKGFFIAGHCGNLYDIISINGEKVGTVAARRFGGNCDASFVNMDISSSYTQSRVLRSTYTIDSSSSVNISGRIYGLFGAKSGISFGEIVDKSFDPILTDPDTGVDYKFKDMIKAKITSQAGDSGGPLVLGESGTSCSIYGVLSGGNPTAGVSFYTKFSNIASSFNATLYR